MSKKSARVRYVRGAPRADTRKLDAAQKATQAELDALSARLDTQFGSARGTLLMRGASAWQALTPGTSGHFLKSLGAGADLAYAAVTPAVWQQIGADRTVDGNEVFTDLGSYSVIRLDCDAVTQSALGILAARVSSDNGSTFLTTSGDYKIFTAVGSTTDLDTIRLLDTNATAARYSSMIIYNWNLAKPKMVHGFGEYLHYINTSAAMNALQLRSTGAGTPNGGTARLFGIPA